MQVLIKLKTLFKLLVHHKELLKTLRFYASRPDTKAFQLYVNTMKLPGIEKRADEIFPKELADELL